MKYVGTLPESEASHYAQQQFSHTETHGGRTVNYFHCWTKSDEIPPTFGENLNIKKIKQVDLIIRRNHPDDDY